MLEKENIQTMSEIPAKGPQFEFYKEIAKEYRAYVFAGFYEQISDLELLKNPGTKTKINLQLS